MTEAAVDHGDIQGLVRGFGVEYGHAIFRCYAFRDGRARDALGAFDRIASVHDLDSDIVSASGLNVALSHPGLQRLGLPLDLLHSFPSEFRQGMAARATDNGDVGDSAPERWDRYWHGQYDMLVAVYGRTKGDARQLDRTTERRLNGLATSVGHQPAGHVIAEDPQLRTDGVPGVSPIRSRPLRIREHFGFIDGVSDVPIQGLSRGVDVDGRIDGQGHWQSLAAGEFLLGYADEAGEVPAVLAKRSLALNGTFLVYRKLYQNVPAFRDYLAQRQAELRVSAMVLAEKMVGRRHDGRPIAGLAGELKGTRYADDRQGRQCPLGSHARRANPRDQFGDDTALVDRHRILRRGMTYGRYLPERYQPRSSIADRGLVFIALNASINRQFEFIQRQWLNTGTSLGQGSDPDPLVGPRVTGAEKFIVPGDATHPTVICATLPAFVTTRGGGYFFLPGIRAIRGLSSGRFDD